jgi:hypothetical protein
MSGQGKYGKNAKSNKKLKENNIKLKTFMDIPPWEWPEDAAWSHIATLITTEGTDKYLLLAAIEAVASIRPQEAAEILLDLADSEDEDIADAAYEAMAMSEVLLDLKDDDQDDESCH